MKKSYCAEELEERIKEYFDYCDGKNLGKKDIIKPYTLSGLLCFLSLSRDEYTALLKNRRLSKIFSRASARIEAYIEENMLTGALSCNASLNTLKYSFDWGEKPQFSEVGDGVLKVCLSQESKDLAR